MSNLPSIKRIKPIWVVFGIDHKDKNIILAGFNNSPVKEIALDKAKIKAKSKRVKLDHVTALDFSKPVDSVRESIVRWLRKSKIPESNIRSILVGLQCKLTELIKR